METLLSASSGSSDDTLPHAESAAQPEPEDVFGPGFRPPSPGPGAHWQTDMPRAGSVASSCKSVSTQMYHRAVTQDAQVLCSVIIVTSCCFTVECAAHHGATAHLAGTRGDEALTMAYVRPLLYRE